MHCTLCISWTQCLHVHYYQEGRTALLVACWEKHYDIVHQLLGAGASPNAQDQVSGLGHVESRLILMSMLNTL